MDTHAYARRQRVIKLEGSLLDIRRQAIRTFRRTKCQVRCQKCGNMLAQTERLNHSQRCAACDDQDTYILEEPLSNAQRARNAHLRGDEV